MNRRPGQLTVAVATFAVAIAAAPAVPVSAHGPAPRDMSIQIVSVDLTDGVAATPAAAASVDLGGATSNFPMTELLDADAAVNLCGANAAVVTRDAPNCSVSGGNQSGGVTEALFDTQAGAARPAAPHVIPGPGGGQPRADGVPEGIGGDPAGGRNGGPGGGAFGSLPMTGLSAGSLLLAAAGLLATAVASRHTRRMGAMR